jgi:hypothetical protein
MSRTWIETESGNLINSDAVSEFTIIGPYNLSEPPGECDRKEGYYSLYALNVGEPEVIHHSTMKEFPKVFRDSHRYLIQLCSYKECEFVLDRLKETLRNGGRYFDALEMLDWHGRCEESRAKYQAEVKTNGHPLFTQEQNHRPGS